MKFVKIFCITCLALFWCVTAWSKAGVKQGVKPVLIIQEKVHTFEQVLEGIDVRHDFIVQNKGDAVLKIEKVDSTWGCTATSFTKTILPGGEGKISIKLSTKNTGGQNLSKTIKVHTNDPFNEKIPLTIKGHVKKFADISSSYISFRGNIGTPMERKVSITPLKEYPFKIKSIKSKNIKELDISWYEVKTDNGMKYEIIARNTRTTSGRIKNYIKIKTDSKEKPNFLIYVGGYLLNPVKPKTKK